MSRGRRRQAAMLLATATLATTALVGLAAAGELHLSLSPVAAARWCMTRGRVAPLPSGRARIDEPKVRAVLPGSDGNAAELRFVYLGPSASEAPLASGEVRRQIGLKLRAQDGCNLLYVMWRIAPVPQLVVSVKRNPGQRTHRECGARGYRNLRPRAGVPPAALAPGQEHVLAAAIDGRRLRVWADGGLAWEGELDDEALASVGPAGMRSDNGRFEAALAARVRPEASCSVGVEAGDED